MKIINGVLKSVNDDVINGIFVLPKDATRISVEALSNCHVKTIRLHDKIDNIPMCCFVGCNGLKNIEYMGASFQPIYVDESCFRPLNEKSYKGITFKKCSCNIKDQHNFSYTAAKGGYIASGRTPQEANTNLKYKILQSKCEDALPTKEQLRNFAQAVVMGNIGNYYALNSDGSWNEFTDCYSYVPGQNYIIKLQCENKMVIRDTFEYIVYFLLSRPHETNKEDLYEFLFFQRKDLKKLFD